MGGREAAAFTKGIMGIIKLFTVEKGLLYHKQTYGFGPFKPSAGYNLARNDESDLAAESWVGRFYKCCREHLGEY